MRLPANGAVSMSGYAGNTQVGVIMWIGNTLSIHEHRHDDDETERTTYKVDHKMRYRPALAAALSPVYIQNKICRVLRSQTPQCGAPYWHMLVRITAMLAMYEDSEFKDGAMQINLRHKLSGNGQLLRRSVTTARHDEERVR